MLLIKKGSAVKAFAMEDDHLQPASTTRVIIAFAIVYIVWGSTYFFIRIAVEEIPVAVMGFMRFICSGILMLLWCAWQKESIFKLAYILPALATGAVTLYIGNGAVAWSEQFLPSSLVAVFIASSPMWFVLLDYKKWKTNFTSIKTLAGILLGFIGIIFLFGDKLTGAFSQQTSNNNRWELYAFGALTIGSIAWAAGSLFSKYKPTPFSGSLNSGWQMMGAASAFAITASVRGDWHDFKLEEVSNTAWMAIAYLVTMGSLVGYSAYVWLLKVRPATQVSTHAYVNPVVAVMLGVFLGNEKVTLLQLVGLGIILTGVLLVNLTGRKK